MWSICEPDEWENIADRKMGVHVRILVPLRTQYRQPFSLKHTPVSVKQSARIKDEYTPSGSCVSTD